jgi:ABC-type glutathione transport system ATPase component
VGALHSSAEHDVSASILSATDVSIIFPGASVAAVQNVSLEVAAAESIGIVGESGSGKTTLGRALVGLNVPTTGTISVEGKPWSAVRRSDELRRRVQMIFQDPVASLNPRMTAVETIAEVLRVSRRKSRADSVAGALSLLSDVGIPELGARRRPGELSGGQCQRVAIARALACEPDVLIADEPTSSLDVSVQAQILNLVKDLCAGRGLALVMISHDLSVIEYMTQRCLVMRAGRVVEQGLTASVLSEPREPYTKELIACIPRLASLTSPQPRRAIENHVSSEDLAVPYGVVEGRSSDGRP